MTTLSSRSIATKIMPIPLVIDRATLMIADNHQSPIAVDVAFGGELAGSGTATFDWRGAGDEIWRIEVGTESETLVLDKGGSELWVDGKLVIGEASREYRLIYAKFAELLQARQSLVDLRPLQLVADAFLLGDRHRLAPFDS